MANKRIYELSAVSGNYHDHLMVVDKSGLDSAVKIPLSDVQHGVYDARVYGATGNGVTDDTAAIQAAIDAAWSEGEAAIIIPPGNYKVTGLTLYRDTDDRLGGGKGVMFIGYGRRSRIFSATAAPVFSWEAWSSGKYSAKLTLQNLFVQNTAPGGSVAEWSSHDLDTDRLVFRATECVFEYLGGPNDGIHGVGACFDLNGLIASQMLNCWINGGSPIGGGASIGWAAKITNSSQSSFANIYMGTGNRGSAGRGFYFKGGGDILILGMRLDTGSRYDGPSFHFHDTKGLHIHQLRGEGKDSSAFIHVEDSHNITFYNANCPPLTDDTTERNVILIENSNHITFWSCTVKSQDYYGNGKSIVIDANSNYIRFYRLVMVLYPGQTSWSNDLDDNGHLTMIDGSYGKGGESLPPDAVIQYGTYATPPLLIGENGSTITTVHTGYKGWDVGSLNNGEVATTTVTVDNATQYEAVVGVGLTSITSGNWLLYGYMSADLTATVYLENRTGGTVNLAEGTLRVITMRMA